VRPTSVTLLFAFAITLVQATSGQTAKAPARKPTPSASAKSAPAAAAPAASAVPCPCLPTVPQHFQPYSAKQEITRIQTLGDGTTIRTVEEIYLARDAEGRTRRETIRTLNGDPVHMFQVFDYPTQTSYTWNVGANYPQVVTVFRRRTNPQPVAAPPQPQPQRYYPYRMESLPPQTIDGLYVQGTRTVRTTPAGYDGNDRDIVSTTENWFAPSVGLQMRTIMDDPRTGKSTTETTEVKQSNPDPVLFQPPAGFQLRDSTP